MPEIINFGKAKEVFATNEVVLITGSFDILHLGHLRFFSLVKQRVPNGVKSLVVVLSDSEVTRRKGRNRPIFKLEGRVEALSYIQNIDYILPWESQWEKLRSFVKEYKPSYLAIVKGDPGYENKIKYIESCGGKAIIIEPTENISTTSIINKIDA